MSKVSYNSKRLIPAPYVSISKTYQKNGDGEIIGKLYNITVRGKILAWKGSPDSSGNFYTGSSYPGDESISSDARLGAIIRKQNALRQLFSEDGKSFEIQSMDGTQPLRCNPRIISVDTPEGQWYESVDYTVNLEADKIYPETDNTTDNISNYISSVNENWSIGTNEDNLETYDGQRTYSLSHNISVVGKRFYDETGTLVKPAWQQAKEYAVSLLGFDSTIALSSGVNNLPSYYKGLNLVRTEDINENDGTYSVTEGWILASGTATEHFEVSTQTSLNEPYKNVSINGTIQGFEERDSNMNISTSKFDNANTKFIYASGLALSRAQTFAGFNLNIIPMATTIGKNPITGTITYSFDYNNRPSNLIPGVRSESISINDTHRGDVVASIFCIGRTAGPVLQYLGASTDAKRQLQIEILVDPFTYTNNDISTLKTLFNQNPRLNPLYSGAINNIIDAANPINNGYLQSYRDQPTESWDFINGRYSYGIGWTYE